MAGCAINRATAGAGSASHLLWPGSGHPDGGAGLAAGHPCCTVSSSKALRRRNPFPFIALLLVTLGKAVLAYGREVASFKAGSAVRQAIRELVLTRLGRLGPAYIQRRPAGSWASLLLEQIENMQDFFSAICRRWRLPCSFRW